MAWRLSDEALLAGFASGAPDLAAAFVRRFQSRVYGLALGVVHDPRMAEEIANETFVRAWRYAETYDSRRGPVVVWLLAIARNLAVDAHRVDRAEPVPPETMARLRPLDAVAGPEERGAASGQLDRIRGALAELPEGQRRAVALTVLYGYTAQEVSRMERIPLGTAKTRIRSAVLKLRESLGAEG